MKKMTHFTVGTTVYNEEKNICKFIRAVQSQTLPNRFVMKELIVTASGCTDNTVNIVKESQKKDSRIKLIIERQRRGKARAVNKLISKAQSDYIILQSADTLPAKSCYKHLLQKLVKPEVGLVAGKVVPKDNIKTFCGFANHFRWKLHHKINIEYPNRPKVGELVAFKKIFERIPPKTVVDEASVEPLIHLQGYKIVYVPQAIIYNQGPKTLREYLSRRRSIHAGHYITKRKYAYEVVTYGGYRVMKIFLKNLNFNLRQLLFSFLVVLLELIARFFGFLDVKLKLRDQSVWKIAKTTKEIK